MTNHDTPETKFHTLLQEQIRIEFTATQQYIAIAAYLDNDDLPQLAKFFYRQADEEREHAMKIVEYFIDRDFRFEIPGADEVRNQFDTPRDAIALALDSERTITKQVSALAATARDEGDYLGEQFMWSLLEEQVEEEAEMTTLLRVADRAGDNLFDLEQFVARDINS
ncbi:MAG TPA: ferritin-like domain-containing protein [Mycobacterium sp.]|uniref:ferritin n=1 Tax=Mycobacterium sp. TaxID=1785 RepID=UPI002D290AE5|nr:ferritin-like domain-containing protein [Mycobacterium sp.]HXY64910.1 ferritin-like domain-containing protein [Mycobacterium sp.]